MQNIDELLTLKQAAALTGVNRMTIWRAVSKGEIEQGPTPPADSSPRKQAILVSRDSLLSWWKARSVTSAQIVQGVLEQPEDVLEHLEHEIEQPEQTVQSGSELALKVIEKALDRAEQAEHLCQVAVRRAEQAERQAQALQQELHSYKRVLSEQADSLAEERARRLALELEQHPPKLDTPQARPSGWSARWRSWLGRKTGS